MQMICALLVLQEPVLPLPLDTLSPWIDMVTRARTEVFADRAAQTHRRVQRERQLRFLEDEQRADHLRPRRPALRRCADDDVAGAKLEAVPAAAVEDDPLVAAHERHPRSGFVP